MTSETAIATELTEREGGAVTFTVRTRQSMANGLTVMATYEWATEHPHEWVRVRETAAGPGLPMTTDTERVAVTDDSLIEHLSNAADGALLG